MDEVEAIIGDDEHHEVPMNRVRWQAVQEQYPRFRGWIEHRIRRDCLIALKKGWTKRGDAVPDILTITTPESDDALPLLTKATTFFTFDVVPVHYDRPGNLFPSNQRIESYTNILEKYKTEHVFPRCLVQSPNARPETIVEREIEAGRWKTQAKYLNSAPEFTEVSRALLESLAMEECVAMDEMESLGATLRCEVCLRGESGAVWYPLKTSVTWIRLVSSVSTIGFASSSLVVICR